MNIIDEYLKELKQETINLNNKTNNNKQVNKIDSNYNEMAISFLDEFIKRNGTVKEKKLPERTLAFGRKFLKDKKFDFSACVNSVEKNIPNIDKPEAFCARLEKELTGNWPAEKENNN